MRRVFNSLRKKGIKGLFLKVPGRLLGRNSKAQDIKKQGEDIPVNKSQDIYYQKKWINNSLWYSRGKMLKILEKLDLDGEIKERGGHLPYQEREFDILFRIKA